MAPGPKAELVFSFAPFSQPPSPAAPTPVREVTLPVASDGSVHVGFAILNLTNVDAIDSTINLKICDECRFAREPQDSEKPPNVDDESIRVLHASIHAQESFHFKTVDIVPPAGTSVMKMGIKYRCRTCVLHDPRAPQNWGLVYIAKSLGSH